MVSPLKDGKNIQRNYSFNWLDDEEKRYVGDLITSNIDDFTINIRNLEQMGNTISFTLPSPMESLDTILIKYV